MQISVKEFCTLPQMKKHQNLNNYIHVKRKLSFRTNCLQIIFPENYENSKSLSMYLYIKYQCIFCNALENLQCSNGFYCLLILYLNL